MITGNTKDFLKDWSVRVVTPREWLGIKKDVRRLREPGQDERAALIPGTSQ